MGEECEVKWSGFADNLCNSFKDFQADTDFSDITLACKDGQVEAHRVVLALGSPHLQALMRSNPQHRLVYLRGVALPDLKAVVTFMYCGKVTVQQDKLPDLLALAEELQVKGLFGASSGGGERRAEALGEGQDLIGTAGKDAANAVGNEMGVEEEAAPQIVIDVEVKEEEPPAVTQVVIDVEIKEDDAEEGFEGEGSDQPVNGRPEEQGRDVAEEMKARGSDGSYRAAKPDRPLLEEHIKKGKKKGKDIYSCRKCNTHMKHKTSMLDHVEAVHCKGTYEYVCAVCYDVLPTKKGYYRHKHQNNH
jgi:hypothetical protein